MKEQQPISFYELVDYVKSDLTKQQRELDQKYIYTAADIDTRDKQLDDQFYIDEKPEVIGDSDVLPLFAKEQRLEVFCSGAILIDVFNSAIRQKPDASAQELLDALEHYLVQDGFYIFGAPPVHEKQLALLPHRTPKLMSKLLKRYGEYRLRKYAIHDLHHAVLLVSDDEKADLRTLCQFAAREDKAKTAKALHIAVLKQEWTHILSDRDGWISPARYILPGQERKKNPKTRVGPIPAAFLSFSKECKEPVIDLYLKAAQNSDEVKAECILKAGEYFVREADRYPVGDGRQVFDFLDYLGFDIPADI